MMKTVSKLMIAVTLNAAAALMSTAQAATNDDASAGVKIVDLTTVSQ